MSLKHLIIVVLISFSSCERARLVIYNSSTPGLSTSPMLNEKFIRTNFDAVIINNQFDVNEIYDAVNNLSPKNCYGPCVFGVPDILCDIRYSMFKTVRLKYDGYTVLIDGKSYCPDTTLVNLLVQLSAGPQLPKYVPDEICGCTRDDFEW